MPPLLSKGDQSKKWTCQNIPGAASLNSPYGFNRDHFIGLIRGTSYWCFSHQNSNLLEISFYSFANLSKILTTKYCTCHDSIAVIACAKNCSDLVHGSLTILRRIYHETCILYTNVLVKWAQATMAQYGPHRPQRKWGNWVATIVKNVEFEWTMDYFDILSNPIIPFLWNVVIGMESMLNYSTDDL